MQDLKEVTQESHYENFRAAQLSGESPVSHDLIDSPVMARRWEDFLWICFELILNKVNY